MGVDSRVKPLESALPAQLPGHAGPDRRAVAGSGRPACPTAVPTARSCIELSSLYWELKDGCGQLCQPQAPTRILMYLRRVQGFYFVLVLASNNRFCTYHNWCNLPFFWLPSLVSAGTCLSQDFRSETYFRNFALYKCVYVNKGSGCKRRCQFEIVPRGE